MKKVGILFQPKKQAAVDLAKSLAVIISELDVSAWTCSSWEEEKAKKHIEGTELIVSLGGDGTILRAARIVNALSIPILGVNLGRLGFMTEIYSEDALNRVPDFIKGAGMIEEHAMLQAEIASENTPIFHALNDIVVGRGSRCRMVRIKTMVNQREVTCYKCDGIIASTATGSTGYSLAAGGPILYPLSKDILLQPIAVHLGLIDSLVLPPDAVIKLEVSTTHEAVLSIDGQVEAPLSHGSIVTIKRSPYVTKLIRSEPPDNFYATLVKKLAKRE